MKTTIKYPRFEYQFGRNIAFGQLWSSSETPECVFTGSIAQILQYAYTHEIEIENSQEILDLIVRQNGFAS